MAVDKIGSRCVE